MAEYMELDHLAICATSLSDGVVYVENLLGVTMAPGGEHALMGTHNRLLSLGPSIYLEVIAINPDAPPPACARWFDLDNFAGPPRLSNWVARCDDMATALTQAPAGIGQPVALARGDLRWQMAVPDDGRLPFDGVCPALICWQDAAHPAARLPDQGCRLLALDLVHPDPQNLGAFLTPLAGEVNPTLTRGPVAKITARISTPTGERLLQ